jgi:hypothetical protein
MRRRRTRSGVGSRAGAVAAAGERAARQRSAGVSTRAPSAECAHWEYPEYPMEVPGVRIGVLGVLTRGELRLDSHGQDSGWHREW